MPPKSDRVSSTLRQEVASRANHRCEYCLSPDNFSPDSFTTDHIYPRFLGGKSTSDNLSWACFGCNGRKHIKTKGEDPQTHKAVSFFNPRTQNWLAQILHQSR
ncbi:HNH endonuclease [cf. Phormidesmis sp. LEGE 11477]|uniref:HNH endonuclease n=1 Tax=cf. Phormidesmis sp. LEGE 11477 TaxID=1828680 RepID=UPI0018828838|nr:HNH endonuclease [cf. Phormidesmis sp. LEGE 11477]